MGLQVLHIIKNFDFGGAENYLCDLANSLNDAGHKVYIIARNGRQKSRLNKNISFIPLFLNDWLIPLHLLQICFFLKYYKIQVIHAHQRLPMLLAAVAGKLMKIPVVITVHGRARYDLRSFISRKYSNKLIFVSRFVKEASLKFPDIDFKSEYIPNGVSISPKIGIRNNGQICYMSRIDKKHASLILLLIQSVLPKLFIQFPHLTFTIIGEGKYLGKLKKEADQLNSVFKSEKCAIKGFQAEVTKYIKNSALVLGVGRVAIESLANGTPVISVNNNRMGDIISTKNYPFYKENNFVAVGSAPPNENSLLTILTDFFTHQSIWLTDTENIQKLIEKEFNITTTTHQIVHLYKNLIKQ